MNADKAGVEASKIRRREFGKKYGRRDQESPRGHASEEAAGQKHACDPPVSSRDATQCRDRHTDCFGATHQATRKNPDQRVVVKGILAAKLGQTVAGDEAVDKCTGLENSIGGTDEGLACASAGCDFDFAQ